MNLTQVKIQALHTQSRIKVYIIQKKKIFFVFEGDLYKHCCSFHVQIKVRVFTNKIKYDKQSNQGSEHTLSLLKYSKSMKSPKYNCGLDATNNIFRSLKHLKYVTKNIV